MPFNTTTLLDDFITAIQDEILGQVIPAEETDAPRPSIGNCPEGFSTCKISLISIIGRPEYFPVDDNGDQVVKIQTPIEFEVQTFGPNAMGRLNGLKFKFGTRSFRGKLIPLFLSFIRTSDVLDISNTLDTDWEERAQMTARFNTGDTITDNVGVIENAEITENYNDDSGTIVRTLQNDITTP